MKLPTKPITLSKAAEIARGSQEPPTFPVTFSGKNLPVVQSGFWDLYRNGVTQGVLGEFLSCPERTRLGMVEGYSKVGGTEALVFGSIVHDTLDKFYSTAMEHSQKGLPVKDDKWIVALIREILVAQQAKYKKMLDEGVAGSFDDHKQLEENFGQAQILCMAYAKKWMHDFFSFDWVGLEQIFDVPYSPKARLGLDRPNIPTRGKFDGIYKNKDGRLWLFETKTKGRIDEDGLLNRLGFDMQVLFYLTRMKEIYGEYPGGVCYNLMRKPQLRQKKDESTPEYMCRILEDVERRPEWYFIRYNCSFGMDDYVKFEKELDSIMMQVIRWYEGEFHYRNSAACSGTYNCKYLPICGGSDDTYFTKREHVFPELVEVTNA